MREKKRSNLFAVKINLQFSLYSFFAFRGRDTAQVNLLTSYTILYAVQMDFDSSTLLSVAYEKNTR